MGSLTFTIISQEQLSPDIIFTVGKWLLKRDEVGNIGGHFTLIWKKINGNWVIISDHTS